MWKEKIYHRTTIKFNQTINIGSERKKIVSARNERTIQYFDWLNVFQNFR